MTRCKRERPEMIFKRVMGLLESVDMRVTGLNNTADHLTIKHLEHEQTHQKYQEQTQEKMNDMNYKILEIRQLCGFSKNRDAMLRGTPDGEESFPTEDLVKSCGKKWMKVAKGGDIAEEETAEPGKHAK